MATVYLAHDLRHHRPVALKLLHPELAHALGPERFRREIETAASLQHPHILPVFDSGEATPGAGEGGLWYTMPYVEGESLRSLLRREGQLPLDTAIRLAGEVAQALHYAHRRGIVHRDIKPENILLSGGYALVADFGIAKALGDAGEERLTGTGLSLGTPAYMSPEQAAGSRDLDGRSDLYSLGCVLYEMLAGAPPFTGPTPQAVIARRILEPPPPLRAARAAVPEALEHVVLRALAREPVDRFATAADFARVLAEAPQAGPASSVTPAMAKSPSRPNRWARPLGLAALLSLTAVASRLVWRSWTAPLELKSDLVAVAPFDVLDPSLDLWHEGLVDLLARALDGAGPLRTVSPTVSVRRWHGRADPTSAAALGRRTGARLTVYGSLVRSGTDSVRLAATVQDAGRERALGEVEVRGSLTHMDLLTDSLALGLLGVIGRTRPVGALRHSGLGARSLPALKAFLRAEQHYRRGAWDSAQAYAEQAVALDTSFALAYKLLAGAIAWRVNRPQELDPSIYSLRAGALNRGLAPRDSLLVLAESLGVVIRLAGAPSPFPEGPSSVLAARLVAVLEQAVRRYPEDPGVWNDLGEVRHHLGVWLVRSGGWRETLATFSRAVAIDPFFGPAYVHPIELSFAMGDTAQAQRLIAAVQREDPDCTSCPGFEAVRRLLALPDSAARERALDTLPTDLMRVVYVTLAHWPDPAEFPLRILRHLRPRDRALGEGGLARTLVFRGHLREAVALGDTTDSRSPMVFAEAALLGSVPAKRASAEFAGWLQQRSFWSVLALPWWSARGDTTRLRAFLDLVESTALRQRSSGGPSPDELAWSTPMSALAQAHLFLARGDTAGALRAYGPVLTACPWWCQGDRLAMARLLAARSRPSEAARILAAPSTLESDIQTRPSDLLWYLERGRVAERLGDRARALEAYGYVSAAWRRPDPELEPYAAEARAGVARLTSEFKQR